MTTSVSSLDFTLVNHLPTSSTVVLACRRPPIPPTIHYSTMKFPLHFLTHKQAFWPPNPIEDGGGASFTSCTELHVLTRSTYVYRETPPTTGLVDGVASCDSLTIVCRAQGSLILYASPIGWCSTASLSYGIPLHRLVERQNHKSRSGDAI